MKFLWWRMPGRSKAYMCFIISLIWLLWLMGNPWGENWSLLTDSEEYTLPELTSRSSSPFNPSSSTEPHVVMQLLLKHQCVRGIWSHSWHCSSVRLAKHHMSDLCIQALLDLFKKLFLIWYPLWLTAISMRAVHLLQWWHCPLSGGRLCPSAMCWSGLSERRMLPSVQGW